MYKKHQPHSSDHQLIKMGYFSHMSTLVCMKGQQDEYIKIMFMQIGTQLKPSRIWQEQLVTVLGLQRPLHRVSAIFLREDLNSAVTGQRLIRHNVKNSKHLTTMNNERSVHQLSMHLRNCSCLVGTNDQVHSDRQI